MAEIFANHIGSAAAEIAGKIVFAVIVFFVGCFLVRFTMKTLPKSKLFLRLEPSARSFLISTLKIFLYTLLIIIVISVLGVPTASIVAALTSAFLAVGLALQGALSNFAGGIMILIFKPFKVGDYITCSGGTGTVNDISVFYTVIITDDNNRITVPNGSLMNDSVVNHTAEDTRRADVKFTVSYDADIDEISKLLLAFAEDNSKALKNPKPEIKVVAYADTGITCSFRVWCVPGDYWNLYFEMMREVDLTFKKLDIPAPAAKILCDVNEK